MSASAFGGGSRRLLAGGLAIAMAAGGSLVVAAPASADESVVSASAGTVTDAVFQWGLSNEQGAGAYDGSCNFLSAGEAGDTEGSRAWTEADGFYSTHEGNVTVLRADAAGTGTVEPTWATKCQDPNGVTVSPFGASKFTGNFVKIAAGTGFVDAESDTAEIRWTGSFTSAFYGGMTYWSATDPRLVVKDGVGTVTATLSGSGADMTDTSAWVTLEPREVVIANLSDVDVTEDGAIVTPDYLGVTVTTGEGTTNTTTGANWGAFPQSFVDFQKLTGQSSYWYSSGSSGDVRKPATPITVGYSAPVVPTVTVSETSGLDAAGDTVTVHGEGFVKNGAYTTATRPPLAGTFGGIYVIFGKFADSWKPTAGAANTARPAIDSADQKWVMNAENITGPFASAGVPINADGSFDLVLKVKSGQFDKTGNYGVYTYGASGVNYAPYETFTPIDLEDTAPVFPTQPASVSVPAGASASLKAVVAADPAPTLQWQSSVDGEVWEDVPAATTATLSIASVTSDVHYRLVATNGLGTTISDVATVAVKPVLAAGKAGIAHTARVGSSVRAYTSGWPAGATLTYQWNVNGEPVEGATGITFTPTTYGSQVSLTVTAAQDGFVSASATSTSQKVQAGVFSAGKVAVTGQVKVGAKVVAKITDKPSGATFTYQWRANGKAIAGATSKSLKVPNAVKGKRLTVTVTAAKTGYSKAVSVSAPTAKVK